MFMNQCFKFEYDFRQIIFSKMWKYFSIFQGHFLDRD